MRREFRFAVTGVAVLCLFVSAPLDTHAQIIPSEPSTVSQTVDGTVVTIEYSRPSLRGRERIFGTEVPFDTLWTPGANWATTFETSKDIELEGVAVPAGKYTLWMVTGRGDWEVVLDPRDKVFHVPHPARSDSQLVFTVTPDTTAPLVQTLQFTFPNVTSTGADLELRWEHTAVTMTYKVTPSQILTITPEQAAPYLGHYRATVNAEEGAEPFSFEFDMALHGDYMGGVIAWDESYKETMYFAVKTDQVLTPVITINGSVAGVIDQAFVEFVMDEDGRAASFELRGGPEDQLWMSGLRVELE